MVSQRPSHPSRRSRSRPVDAQRLLRPPLRDAFHPPVCLHFHGMESVKKQERSIGINNLRKAALRARGLQARQFSLWAPSLVTEPAPLLQKVHRHGTIPYDHPLLGAVRLHPACRAVMPLMPEPIMNHDGTGQNDGERHAAKRFITTLRRDHPHLQFIVTADRLRSHAPHMETLHDAGCHSILGVKAGDHAHVFTQVQAAQEAGAVTAYARHDRATGVLHRCRVVNAMPLHASRADVRVNFMAYWEITPGHVQHVSWGTDVRVSTRHVSKLMQGGRARWKIANETLHTLTNQGENFEHTDGHGEKHLSVVCATLMLLACLVEQTQQCCCTLFQAVWATLGSTRLLWERMRARLYDDALTSMRQLWEALLSGFTKSHPVMTSDASSGAACCAAMHSLSRRSSPPRPNDAFMPQETGLPHFPMRRVLQKVVPKMGREGWLLPLRADSIVV